MIAGVPLVGEDLSHWMSHSWMRVPEGLYTQVHHYTADPDKIAAAGEHAILADDLTELRTILDARAEAPFGCTMTRRHSLSHTYFGKDRQEFISTLSKPLYKNNPNMDMEYVKELSQNTPGGVLLDHFRIPDYEYPNYYLIHIVDYSWIVEEKGGYYLLTFNPKRAQTITKRRLKGKKKAIYKPETTLHRILQQILRSQLQSMHRSVRCIYNEDVSWAQIAYQLQSIRNVDEALRDTRRLSHARKAYRSKLRDLAEHDKRIRGYSDESVAWYERELKHAKIDPQKVIAKRKAACAKRAAAVTT